MNKAEKEIIKNVRDRLEDFLKRTNHEHTKKEIEHILDAMANLTIQIK